MHWYSVTNDEIRSEDQYNVITNETIKPVFTDENSTILLYDDIILYNGDIGVPYIGWETIDHTYIGNKGATVSYDGSYTELYPVLA